MSIIVDKKMNIRKLILVLLVMVISIVGLIAQQKALVNTSKSRYSRLTPVDADAVQWTGGFWGRWYQVSKDTMAMNMLRLYKNDSLCHGFRNFEIAAGQAQGDHRGAPFHDGDFYKIMEAMISIYSVNNSKELGLQIDFH